MGSKKRVASSIAIEPQDTKWRTPVQQELDGLFGELSAFNERIAELVKDGHRSHAIIVLKAQALSLASQIDELRGILIVTKKPPTISKSK
jgi:hypothetical protein